MSAQVLGSFNGVDALVLNLNEARWQFLAAKIEFLSTKIELLFIFKFKNSAQLWQEKYCLK